MKSFFLICLVLMLNLSIFSQIVVEYVDLMQPGDTFLIHVDLNPTITLDLSPGADLTWDFTGLQNDQSNYACYAPANDLEFIEEFPMSEFYTYGPGFLYAGPGGVAPLNNFGYMMFFTSPDGLFTEGFYSDYGYGYRSTLFNVPEMLMFTDAHYLDERTINSAWEVMVDFTNETPVNLDTLYRRGVSKVLNADAWGSLTTDYGTYDVLRIHETGISIDSAFARFNGMNVYSMEMARDTINNYYFWAKELRNPVLTLHCDYNDNIERIDYLMGAIYSESKLNISTTKDINIFPNPSNDAVFINGLKGHANLINCSGHIVKSFFIQEDSFRLDIQNLPSGLYCVTDDFGNIARFIIE